MLAAPCGVFVSGRCESPCLRNMVLGPTGTGV
jgi:hypothetical protein